MKPDRDSDEKKAAAPASRYVPPMPGYEDARRTSLTAPAWWPPINNNPVINPRRRG